MTSSHVSLSRTTKVMIMRRVMSNWGGGDYDGNVMMNVMMGRMEKLRVRMTLSHVRNVLRGMLFVRLENMLRWE